MLRIGKLGKLTKIWQKLQNWQKRQTKLYEVKLEKKLAKIWKIGPLLDLTGSRAHVILVKVSDEEDADTDMKK